MAAEFIFARHGESTANLTRTITNRVPDSASLTERGRRQAEGLLAALKSRPVTAVYSSPLLRARETAFIVASGFDIPVEIADHLREPFCGAAEGRSDEDAWKMHSAQEQAWQTGNYDYHIPGGESFNDVRSRFIPFVRQVVTTHASLAGAVVMISHGSLLMNMLPLVMLNLSLDFARSQPLGNCTFITAEITRDGLVCREWDGRPVNAGPRE